MATITAAKNSDVDFYQYACPHCKGDIIVAKNEINCAVFRHGIYKANNQQMNPHAPKKECDDAVARDLIRGCGKPFRINDKNEAEACDYI